MSEARWHFYDKSGKWLIDHHGDSILRLAQVANIEWWRAAQADVVQPEQLPDGLLEVKLLGQAEPTLFVLELATYPEQRLIEQLIRDVTLVYLSRAQLPEAIAVILHPKGKLRIPEGASLSSAQGMTHLQLRWRIVELWTVPAELLLASQDVGLIPWVPLTKTEDAPDVLLHKCRERIDALAPAHERTQLLVVTHILASLRYNEPQLLALLGGMEHMQLLDFPAVRDFVDKTVSAAVSAAVSTAQHKDILRVVSARFGATPPELEQRLQALTDGERLGALLEHAATCQDLDAFRAKL